MLVKTNTSTFTGRMLLGGRRQEDKSKKFKPNLWA
jgi:hypothetical protein